jgi:hypothetical protein
MKLRSIGETRFQGRSMLGRAGHAFESCDVLTELCASSSQWQAATAVNAAAASAACCASAGVAARHRLISYAL